ncbi:MAG TPA: SDR family oxidoreductase, partial [Alphaproteobacteria bacterium]|nr:SDR family oxidoreductase [Alphaproteobacteria bacterium]
SRGLGLEFTRQYLADGWDVHACARDLGKGELASLKAKYPAQLSAHKLDVTDHAAIKALSTELKSLALDVLLNNAGIYGPTGFDGQGQNLESMDADLWARVLSTNTIAPYKMTQAFLPQLQKGKNPRAVFITSKMGSITEMKNSGMVSTAYQSSKAALNMAGVCLATELKPKGVAVILLHPGWVQTDMGGSEAPLQPEEAVSGMRQVIDKSTLRDTASFRDYQGKALPW